MELRTTTEFRNFQLQVCSFQKSEQVLQQEQNSLEIKLQWEGRLKWKEWMNQGLKYSRNKDTGMLQKCMVMWHIRICSMGELRQLRRQQDTHHRLCFPFHCQDISESAYADALLAACPRPWPQLKESPWNSILQTSPAMAQRDDRACQEDFNLRSMYKVQQT